jgi:hypothetical protein
MRLKLVVLFGCAVAVGYGLSRWLHTLEGIAG